LDLDNRSASTNFLAFLDEGKKEEEGEEEIDGKEEKEESERMMEL
jgi:hypothetical protein